MDLGLSGTAAIVGGASSGIGLGIARALAAEGCAVTAIARGQERLERAAAEIGAGTIAAAGDVRDTILSNAIRPGVVGWAKTLAQEPGPDGITVNTVAPGKIDTERVRELWGHRPDPAAAERADIERVPARRLGQPDELGAAVAFLCSTRAAYISGTVLPVDGGLLRGLW
jgi:3-oxoacyl-[acyl-carrier protein] reductase